MELETIDFNRMPLLKALLTNYILFMYNGDAIITDEYLEMEYFMLERENRLHELFVQEVFDNSGVPLMLK